MHWTVSMGDVRLALRSLRTRPALTLAAITALGLALGASATIFALADALWLRPAGMANPSTMVRVFGVTADANDAGWSLPEVHDLQARVTSLEPLVGRGPRGILAPDADGASQLVLVNVVTPGFFEALGVRALHGRLPDGSDTGPVAALGHAYWRTRFGGDPAVVGTTLPLGGRRVPVTIAGVLPPSFRDLDPATDRDLWLPTGTWAHLGGTGDLEDRAFRWFTVIGRRVPGVSAAAAAAELDTLVPGIAAGQPGEPVRRVRVVTDLAYRLERGGTNALALLALVAVVSLITCVNLAELLQAAVGRRRQELATRVALGASPSRLGRTLLAESLWLGVGGCLVGAAVARAMMRVVPAVLVPPPGFRSVLDLSFDGRVMAALIGTALVCTALFSIIPVRMAARTDLLPIIKGGEAALSGRRRTPLGLAAQVALAFVLLAAAAILGRAFLASQSQQFGLTSAPVLTAWSPTDLPAVRRAEALQRLRALPGVRDVAVAIRAPLSLSGGGRAEVMRLPILETPLTIKYNAVDGRYFSVVGTRIEAGRAFTDEDESSRRRVAIISRALAARWPASTTALGSTLRIGGDQTAWEIVGIAEDAAINAIGEPAEPYVYLPFGIVDPGEVTFLLSLADGAPPPARDVRTTLMAIDPALEPRRIITLADYVAYATSDARATATLAGALGTLGLLLTIVGMYGVTAHRASRRIREFGIRAALGATRRQVLWLALRDTLRVGGLGLGAGVLVSLWTNRALGSMLIGVTPWDPASLVSTGVLLGTALLLAGLGPAVRSMGVNPVDALRER